MKCERCGKHKEWLYLFVITQESTRTGNTNTEHKLCPECARRFNSIFLQFIRGENFEVTTLY